jgi:cytoskeletal protein RodZ
MNDLAEKLKKARLDKKLTIQQVSEDTAVRSYIIENFENGNFNFLPDVYINSFIKTLLKYYKISADVVSEDKNIEKNKNQVVEKKTELIQKNKNNLNPEIITLKEQFRKKEVKKVSKISLYNYIIFGLLFVSIVVAIIITIISLKGNNENITEKKVNENQNDTIKIVVDKKNILSYFNTGDSLNLRAVAKDSAWIRVIADNKKYYEQLLKKGETKEWNANEFFIVDIGKVGAITLYRNNQELPLFGKPGTVAKNIKITADNVTNIQSLNLNYDSLNSELRLKKKKKQNEENNKIIILESPIEKNEDPFKKKK